MNSKIIICIGIGIVITIGVIFGISMFGNDLSTQINIESEIEQPKEGKEYVLEFSDMVNTSSGP